MSNSSDRLAAISSKIKKGVAGPTETVRTLLSWFGAERRGYWVVKTINKALNENDLVTEPSFESTWIDGPITFVRKPKKQAEDAPLDPTFRLGRLEAANKQVISVKPNDSLDKAITLMLTNDFSQLPVMTGPRDVKGVVTWKTIGSRLALSKPCVQCRDFMEPAQILSEEVSLLDAVDIIANHDYALVQKSDKLIGGLVTASDFSSQFRTMSKPFLLVGEIENGIRHLLHGKFNNKELQAARVESDATRTVNGPSDLTFGEYVRLLESDTNWKKLGVQIDRVEFIKQLDRVRAIRNDVMHFDPDGLDPDDKKFLTEFAQFLKRLREICG
jgi:hypothetical protein